MEQVNFKRLQCENGKEYVFDSKRFKMELRRSALAAKKEKAITTIEAYEEKLAESIAVTTAAIKQWKAGRNGVSDLERVQEIANYLGLDDYKKLLIEVSDNDEGEDMNMTNYITEDERKAAREVFYGFVDVIKAYKDTEAYAVYDIMYVAPSMIDVFQTNDDLEVTIRKSRFDLSKDTYTKLEQLFFEITSTLPEEIENEGQTSRDLVVERKADEYFEEVCHILKIYIK